MVDDLEFFVLSIFVEFIVACGETNLSSQKGQFLAMSAFRFTALDQDLARVGVETRYEMLARSGGARGALVACPAGAGQS